MIKLSTARYAQGYHGIVTRYDAGPNPHEIVTPYPRPSQELALEDARALALKIETQPDRWTSLECPRCRTPFTISTNDYRRRKRTAKRRGTIGRVFCSRSCANSATMTEKNKAGITGLPARTHNA